MQEHVLAIQHLYPQVYHACHRRHVAKRSNERGLTERDASILAHLGPEWPTSVSELAHHFGVGLPTMSEAVARLERLGYVERGERADDRRARALRLTEAGRAAVGDSSVLDAGRLERVLARLSEEERRAAVRGLELLARAARDEEGRG